MTNMKVSQTDSQGRMGRSFCCHFCSLLVFIRSIAQKALMPFNFIDAFV